jgi:hypothetical protein
LPCEFEVSVNVTVQDQILPVLLGVQGLPLKSDNPVGLTVNVGGGGGCVGCVQLHTTDAVLLF